MNIFKNIRQVIKKYGPKFNTRFTNFCIGNEIILGRPCIHIISEIDYIYALNTWILILNDSILSKNISKKSKILLKTHLNKLKSNIKFYPHNKINIKYDVLFVLFSFLALQNL